MKITPAPSAPLCPACLLPTREPHRDLKACIAAHQMTLYLAAEAHNKLQANAECAQKGMGEMIRLLWKLVIGRGEITFTKTELEQIPPGANVTVRRTLEGNLVCAAIVKESKKPEDLLGKDTHHG